VVDEAHAADKRVAVHATELETALQQLGDRRRRTLIELGRKRLVTQRLYY